MLKAPFPWFGGKSRAADLIWQALGDVDSYVEPFFGSGAVLLGRPRWHRVRVETINDKDAYLANFWRAVSMDPDAVAAAADWPVSEADLTARHVWLLEQGPALTERLQCDPTFYDARVAGWWVWGQCAWIGSGWCSGRGPWRPVDGKLSKSNAGQGINRQLPHLGDAGRGINRQLPHLGNAGRGINRKLPHLGDAGRGIQAWMRELQQRLRRVRVCCGDWQRVLSRRIIHPAISGGDRDVLAGIVFDPPYLDGFGADGTCYTGGGNVAREVEAWCRENGHREQLRIILCGYAGNYDLPGWRQVNWKAAGGYANTDETKANSHRETLWLSPACLGEPEQLGLFAPLESPAC
jgi:DNA adenine methylase